MNFFEFVENIENYSNEDLLDDIQISLEKDNEILQLQKQQWDKGEDSEGKVLGYYSLATELLSGGRKKQGDRYNLLDTGNFRNETYLLPTQKQDDLFFDYDSSGINTPSIIETIGPTVFGLQAENKDKFTTIAVEKAIKLLNTNLKFT